MVAHTDTTTTTIEYLAEYQRALEHQREHSELVRHHPLALGPPQPWQYCWECLKERKYRDPDDHDGYWVGKEFQRRFSWAIPTETALKTIADRSPRGVVEIGAGGGYWTMLLRARGVDVVAYDLDPTGTYGWFSGEPWTEVLEGDHTRVTEHTDRTLFLCWPSLAGEWTHEVLELYRGDTVIYIGEGGGGCTGTDKMHALLGRAECWHDEDESSCAYCATEARFEQVADVYIPQWMGLHDRLTVHAREGRLYAGEVEQCDTQPRPS